MLQVRRGDPEDHHSLMRPALWKDGAAPSVVSGCQGDALLKPLPWG